MAELLRRADRNPDQLDELSFTLLAPREQIDIGIFSSLVTRDSIHQKVQSRIESYAGERDEWFHTWFTPTLQQISLAVVAWEDLIDDLCRRDKHTADELDRFYQQCLIHNRPATTPA